MVFDNVVVPRAGGRTASAADAEAADWAGPGAAQVRELAEVIRGDERLMPLFLPVGEGILAAVKRT